VPGGIEAAMHWHQTEKYRDAGSRHQFGGHAACNHGIEEARPTHVPGGTAPMGRACHIIDGGERPHCTTAAIDGLLNGDNARAGSAAASLTYGRIDLGASKNPARSR